MAYALSGGVVWSPDLTPAACRAGCWEQSCLAFQFLEDEKGHQYCTFHNDTVWIVWRGEADWDNGIKKIFAGYGPQAVELGIATAAP